MDNNKESRLKTIISKVFNVNYDKLSDDSSPENISNWDSLSHLMLIAALEDNFQIKFTTEEVITIRNIRDIKDILQKKEI